jgi:hypothetical protein
MNLQDTYSAMHQEAFLLTLAIQEKLQNLPAPDTDGLNWGHVGELGNIIHQLRDILEEES